MHFEMDDVFRAVSAVVDGGAVACASGDAYFSETKSIQGENSRDCSVSSCRVCVWCV